jgi:hypothetical protein
MGFPILMRRQHMILAVEVASDATCIFRQLGKICLPALRAERWPAHRHKPLIGPTRF